MFIIRSSPHTHVQHLGYFNTRDNLKHGGSGGLNIIIVWKHVSELEAVEATMIKL